MRKIKIGTIIIFALIISLPLFFQWIGVSFNDSKAENRRLKARPTFSLEQSRAGKGSLRTALGFYRDVIGFKDAYDKYYSDNFVLKASLFKSYYAIQTNLFGVNALPRKVVKGNNGWFFLGNSYSNVITESKGIDAFKEEELQKIKKKLLQKKAWLKARNIDFYVAVAPNKHSIYGEELPIQKSQQLTKLEQLKALFNPEELNFIDLSDSFPKTPIQRLYHKTNTHWNDYGAYWGYKALASSIKQQYPKLLIPTLDSFELLTEISDQEDLTGMLNIKVKEERIVLQPKNSIAQEKKSTLAVPKNTKNYVFNYTSTANKIKVLAFRDSFFTNLMKFMNETFGETVYIWRLFDEEVIKIEQPDIVILEIIERDLDNLLLLEDSIH
ncbi:alginate O-acetyltransferase AlgX-related protein [Aureispira anguillae]|uniref:AlgX/AlgJ SGNH hydrolase-like domain-containing protein n=1 Tax=Aureispira anguillae TaxID=2864201 RepID=A0A916DWM5_9BACT|nr:hypothetical protein [Aureispira anguillae]BDS14845.1 hypothetical protein AsAng_0056270 [Aureispira anguillae]